MCKVNSSLYYAQTSLAGSPPESAGDAHWIPNTDVYVTEGNLVIKVELAGMRKEDLELAVNAPMARAARSANSWSWKSTMARSNA